MNNAYLKDIIKHDSAYQGVITPDTPINFYSLCKKVFEQASPGNNGNRRTEIYKIVGFNINEFRTFFNSLSSAEVEEINNMLDSSIQTNRKLEIMFISYCYAYKHTANYEDNTSSTLTFYMPMAFTLDVENNEGTKSFSVQLDPLITGIEPPQGTILIGGDLILKAYGETIY